MATIEQRLAFLPCRAAVAELSAPLCKNVTNLFDLRVKQRFELNPLIRI